MSCPLTLARTLLLHEFMAPEAERRGRRPFMSLAVSDHVSTQIVPAVEVSSTVAP